MRETLLRTFLASMHRRRAVLGVCDCTLMAADWIRTATGRDPAADLRGAYHDPETARAIVREAGGILALVRERLEAAGLAETAEPTSGDVGLLDVSAMHCRLLPVVGAVAGIRVGGAWAVKSIRGVFYLEAPYVMAWTV